MPTILNSHFEWNFGKPPVWVKISKNYQLDWNVDKPSMLIKNLINNRFWLKLRPIHFFKASILIKVSKNDSSWISIIHRFWEKLWKLTRIKLLSKSMIYRQLTWIFCWNFIQNQRLEKIRIKSMIRGYVIQYHGFIEIFLKILNLSGISKMYQFWVKFRQITDFSGISTNHRFEWIVEVSLKIYELSQFHSNYFSKLYSKPMVSKKNRLFVNILFEINNLSRIHSKFDQPLI